MSRAGTFNVPHVRLVEQAETRTLAHLANNAPRIPWDKFYGANGVFQWRSGQHVALIGPTGLGKTTMLLNLLPLHPYVVVLATKPRDKTMDKLIATGYVKLERWQSLDPADTPRRVLWPDASRLGSEETQKLVFHDAFDKIYREGYWTIAIDETWWLENKLGLSEDIKTFLLQGRSLDISLILGFQRPAWISREVYSSCTHLMFYRTNDETDLKSLQGIGGSSSDLIRHAVANLDPFQVLYINTRTGYMCRTRAPYQAAA